MGPNEVFSIGLDHYTGSIVRQSYEGIFGWFSKAAEHVLKRPEAVDTTSD